MAASNESNIVRKRAGVRVLHAEALEYHLLKPRDSAHPLAAAVYQLWRDGWLATLREVSAITRIDSDEFARQDLIGVIADHGRCISLTALRFVDRAQPLGRDDSYFKLWPSEALEALGQELLGISSNTLIHPEFRGARVSLGEGPESEPLSLSSVTIALALRRFAESPIKNVVGIARNDRSMNRVAAQLGGRTLGQILVHGTESDLMLLDPNVRPYQSPVIESLWARRNRS